MRPVPVQRVLWSGAETLGQVRDTLGHQGTVEIQLAPDFHHALYRLFHRDTFTPVEQLDMSGGPEIIDRVAQLRGLDDLVAVASLAREFSAEVDLVSPVPLIRITSHAQAVDA